MTGLDLAKDHLIEIAVLITNGNLDIVAKGPELVIHQPKSVMDNMNGKYWCIEHHGASGLTQQVLESKISVQEAEAQVLDFIVKHVPESRVAQLAGNSVHCDKRFLEKEMPKVVDHLHYRIVDVSTVKELARRWYPETYNALNKKGAHRAMGDIIESIEELKFYRQKIFKVE
ncbi:ribonuclease H-like domain-containing protein [Umbelopsis sp. PMI_123]|nr:ribonuclease H-like domain-containing protein [Umbelopsis sp. PMI_123]